jgi:hypothetical protein
MRGVCTLLVIQYKAEVTERPCWLPILQSCKSMSPTGWFRVCAACPGEPGPCIYHPGSPPPKALASSPSRFPIPLFHPPSVPCSQFLSVPLGPSLALLCNPEVTSFLSPASSHPPSYYRKTCFGSFATRAEGEGQSGGATYRFHFGGATSSLPLPSLLRPLFPACLVRVFQGVGCYARSRIAQ